MLQIAPSLLKTNANIYFKLVQKQNNMHYVAHKIEQFIISK